MLLKVVWQLLVCVGGTSGWYRKQRGVMCVSAATRVPTNRSRPRNLCEQHGRLLTKASDKANRANQGVCSFGYKHLCNYAYIRNDFNAPQVFGQI